MQTPLFSVITVSYNAADTIEKTIKSVIHQDYKNIEYIIIDGASTDETMSIVSTYKKHIKTTISEEDSGIYSAMNKGISSARGDFLIFLNADDYLFNSSVISNVAREILRESDHDMYIGDLLLTSTLSGEASIWSVKKITAAFLWNSTLPHPSTIYAKTVFKKIGLFSEEYKISGDYEHFLRAYTNKLSFKKIASLVTIFSTDGLSNNPDFEKLTRTERDKAKRTNFSSFRNNYLRLRVRCKKLFGF